jgi:hypothetical protein
MTRRGAYGMKTALTSPKTFGERLRRIRLAWGWSQGRLAETVPHPIVWTKHKHYAAWLVSQAWRTSSGVCPPSFSRRQRRL